MVVRRGDSYELSASGVPFFHMLLSLATLLIYLILLGPLLYPVNRLGLEAKLSGSYMVETEVDW